MDRDQREGVGKWDKRDIESVYLLQIIWEWRMLKIEGSNPTCRIVLGLEWILH